MKTIAVTGANSAIGIQVVKELRKKNLEVLELSRETKHHSFNLTRKITVPQENIDALIHIAWDWSSDADESRRNNFQNLEEAFRALAHRGTKIVLLSTASVATRKTSHYGQVKFELEELVLELEGSVVRAGVVWGGQLKGILGTIKTLASVPAICCHLWPTPILPMTHLESLGKALVEQTQNTDRVEINLFDETTVALTELAHIFRKHNKQKTLLHLHVPTKFIISCASLLLHLGFKLPFRIDSLRASTKLSLSSLPGTLVRTGKSKVDFKSWVSSAN